MLPVPLPVPTIPTGNETYTQATRLGNLIFVSGQLGIDPATGQLVTGGAVAEYQQALDNLRVILESAGSSLAHVAKTTIYMTDMRLLPELNAVYACYFPHRPAKTGVEVRGLAGGAAIEIEVVAGVADLLR